MASVARRPFQPNEVSAGGVVVRPGAHGPEVVLISDGRNWGLPKGVVERGETAQDAALREVSEETGIERSVLAIVAELPASEYVYRRRDTGRLIFKRVHQFLMSAPEDAQLHRQESEIADAQWLSVRAALQRATFEDTRRALRAVQQMLDSGVAGSSA